MTFADYRPQSVITHSLAWITTQFDTNLVAWGWSFSLVSHKYLIELIIHYSEQGLWEAERERLKAIWKSSADSVRRLWGEGRRLGILISNNLSELHHKMGCTGFEYSMSSFYWYGGILERHLIWEQWWKVKRRKSVTVLISMRSKSTTIFGKLMCFFAKTTGVFTLYGLLLLSQLVVIRQL